MEIEKTIKPVMDHTVADAILDAEKAKEYCKNVLNIKIGRIRYTCDGKTKYSGKLADGTKLTWNWTKNLDKEILNNAEYIDRKKYEEIISAKNK